MSCFHISYGSMDAVKFIHKGNLIFEYITTNTNFAIAQKVEILASLAGKLPLSIESNEKVFIKFESYYLAKDSTAFTLGYDEFEYAPDKVEYKDWLVDSGIVILIRDRSFSILQALKLIHWAADNIVLIKKFQTKRAFLTLGGSSKNSIPFIRIAPILENNDTLVESMVSNRQDQIQLPGYVVYPKYYYKNDKYYLVFSKTSNQPLPDIIHIINLKFGTYMAFVNDSTFYYLEWLSPLKGPFIINGFKDIGMIKYDYLLSDSVNSSTKIRINIDFGMGKFSTMAMFIPSLNKVISRYDTLEDYNLNRILSSKLGTHDQRKTSNLGMMVLGFALLISMILNVYLFIRQKNE